MERMMSYAWPGNVRELGNVIERAAVVAHSGTIREEHLPMDLLEGPRRPARPQLRPLPLREEMALAERRVIEKALRFTGGNRTQAARLLGIHRTGLHQKLRAYGLS
jgi:DNA-binding NtrC family response regulator